MSVPAGDTLGSDEPEAYRFVRLHKRLLGGLGVLLVLALVAGFSLKVWGLPYLETKQAQDDANAAIATLRTGDLTELDQRLRDRRADPQFAYYFAKQATPRDLGDILGPAEDLDLGDEPGGGADADAAATADATTYESTLADLAAVLSLATHGTGDLALPASWTDDFALATTTPERLYPDTSGNAERLAQDVANKQNLLLVLSRGRWSTEFLMAMTSAYWDWEHEPDNQLPSFPGAIPAPDAGPWPGRTQKGAKYAPTPDGTYLTDGMVALMAALTANPEAAGWAFAGFRTGTTALDFGEDEERTIGAFSHYVFFEHSYGLSAETGTRTSGATAAYAALLSAIEAVGGSYSEDAIGPLGDLGVIQDAQEAEQSQEEAQDSEHWYQKVVHAITSWGHTALDIIGLLPVVGEPADGINAVWSGIEGDWAGAGLSLAAMVPFVGGAAVAAKVAKNSARTRKFVDHAGNAIDQSTGGGRLLGKATPIGDGTFDFADADDFAAALKDPVQGVTYKHGPTTYELSANGKSLTHLSGPELGRLPHPVYEGRGRGGYCIVKECKAASLRQEQKGLDDYEAKHGVAVVRTQVGATIDSVASPRYFDGLVRKKDGTYEGIEVKGGGAKRSANQGDFDSRVSYDTPAVATIDGEPIKITSVVLQNVA